MAGQAELDLRSGKHGRAGSAVTGMAGRAFDVLGCGGYARVDFRLSPDSVPFCLEVNTLPGMTSHSLVPLAAQAIGIDFGTLCEQICEIALRPATIKE